MLDTGAQVNILPWTVHCYLAHKPPLWPTQARILAYGSTDPLPLKGQFICDVKCGGKSKNLRFFVPSVKAEALLGLSACEELGLIRRQPVPHTACTLETSNSLGNVQGYRISQELPSLHLNKERHHSACSSEPKTSTLSTDRQGGQ
jgi:hypothetical protein